MGRVASALWCFTGGFNSRYLPWIGWKHCREELVWVHQIDGHTVVLPYCRRHLHVNLQSGLCCCVL